MQLTADDVTLAKSSQAKSGQLHTVYLLGYQLRLLFHPHPCNLAAFSPFRRNTVDSEKQADYQYTAKRRRVGREPCAYASAGVASLGDTDHQMPYLGNGGCDCGGTTGGEPLSLVKSRNFSLAVAECAHG